MWSRAQSPTENHSMVHIAEKNPFEVVYQTNPKTPSMLSHNKTRPDDVYPRRSLFTPQVQGHPTNQENKSSSHRSWNSEYLETAGRSSGLNSDKKLPFELSTTNIGRKISGEPIQIKPGPSFVGNRIGTPTGSSLVHSVKNVRLPTKILSEVPKTQKRTTESNELKVLSVTPPDLKLYRTLQENHLVLFELFGMLSTNVISSRNGTAKHFTLRGGGESVGCVFYEIVGVQLFKKRF
ncbi:uncharacterized protein LOC143245528 [Tachypleus tridentatus]|uniref:uncharacterized protein LOC143245528 n=1 Tax=Tachypleus tridentatus TaxID=6853 RepID=UPI003FD3A89B